MFAEMPEKARFIWKYYAKRAWFVSNLYGRFS